MNSKDTGNITEAMLIAALVAKGERVLVPFGDNLRYDIALDREGSLIRVQCKTGRLRKGVITFATTSSGWLKRGTHRKGYIGEVDFFGIYCIENSTCYLVPVCEVGSLTLASLRVDPTKNKQLVGVRWSKDYVL
jgi:hypothetical protein